MPIPPVIDARIDEIYEEWKAMIGFDEGCALGCAYWFLAAARAYEEAGMLIPATQYAQLATASSLLRMHIPGAHEEPLP